MSNYAERDTYELINEWLISYSRCSSSHKKAKYRELIATRMFPIIKRIAKTIARRSYDPVEDMIQAGSIGLLKAIDNYSFTSNVEFRIYAGHIIIGAMKHYLRDKLNTIRVPRHIQELVYRINTFTSSLTQEELHNLTGADVAEALNVPAEAVNYAMQAERRTSVISLDDLYDTSSDSSLGFEEIIAKDDYKKTAELEDAKLILNDVIKRLPDDCRNAVELYYYKDMNQKEIAVALGMTQMSVSRKLKKAFSILYKQIEDSYLKYFFSD